MLQRKIVFFFKYLSPRNHIAIIKKKETGNSPRYSTVFEGEIRMANVLIQGNCLGKACVSFGLCDKAWTTSKSS